MEVLKSGIAVIENDTHVSKWVKKSGTLKIAESYLSSFRQYIPEGGTVIDVGAMIGDHTATYAEWVGPSGTVWAFEPNPEAYECLRFNMQKHAQVEFVRGGLSDREEYISLQLSDNAGASYLVQLPGPIKVMPLDNILFPRVDFIKIDAEGFESQILDGARKTIDQHRPVMLIEVNHGALIRAGSSSSELLEKIRSFKYITEITDPRLKWHSEQFDVICTPFNLRES